MQSCRFSRPLNENFKILKNCANDFLKILHSDYTAKAAPVCATTSKSCDCAYDLHEILHGDYTSKGAVVCAVTSKSYDWDVRKIVNKTGLSQVGAISKAQKYSKNNYWKHLEKLFFQKKNFRKKVFFRKSHNAEKLKKRPFRLIKRFYKPKTSKKMQGVTL